MSKVKDYFYSDLVKMGDVFLSNEQDFYWENQEAIEQEQQQQEEEIEQEQSEVA